jgi:hypothetical protein
MQGVLACIDANGVSDCSGCLMGYGRCAPRALPSAPSKAVRGGSRAGPSHSRTSGQHTGQAGSPDRPSRRTRPCAGADRATPLHAGRRVFGIGFQSRSIVGVPLKPHLGVSCIWRLLNFAVWPGRKPFGGAENSPIGFICEPKKQVRLCPVLFGEGQSAISDRARIAHGAFSNPNPRSHRRHRLEARCLWAQRSP